MPVKKLSQAAQPVILFVVLLWALELVNWLLFGHALSQNGIVPRQVSALPGIVMAPFLHASVAHMASNTVPMLILGILVGLSGNGRLFGATAVITILGGLGVWVFARGGVHVGASILIFGYFGYLVASAFYERSGRAVLLAAVTLILYAGLIWGVLPTQRGVSWEGHLFGFIGGIVAARLMMRRSHRGKFKL